MSSALNTYPQAAAWISIHETKEEVVLCIDESTITRPGTFAIDASVANILKRADGQTSVASINRSFDSLYGEMFGSVFARDAWTALAGFPKLVSFNAEPTEQPRRINVTGSAKGFYPRHAIIEVIETCNFRCDHCYYSSSPEKKGRMTFNEFEQVCRKLVSEGVRIVELTGGECTIHPDFLRMLDLACELFDMVAIITNGYQIGKKSRIADALTAKKNIIVQISIDAMAEKHNQFRKHKGSFEAAVAATKHLVEHGVKVRIASSITEASVDQVDDLFKLAKSLDVLAFTASPVSAIGRGCNITDGAAGTKALLDKISETLQPYAEDPLLRAPYRSKKVRNCGAGWRTTTIDYDGNARACNFSRDSKELGNLFLDSYESIFTQKSVRRFHDSPSPGGEECDGCTYYWDCFGCHVKAFTVSESSFPDCPWRAKWFPGMPLKLSEEIRLKRIKYRNPKNSMKIPVRVSNH